MNFVISNRMDKIELVEVKELGISPILFNRDDEQYEGVIVNSFEEFENIIVQ